MSYFLNWSIIVLYILIPGVVLAQSENHPPIVKILVPVNNSKHDLNNQIQYKLKVSDQEDGESEYDEIATNEVFLEVRYFPDPSNMDQSISSTADPNGLSSMKKSNCFNCHAFNGKLIAPSFYEISKRYPQNLSTIELLAKRIQEGSTGVWGGASMPTHTEISIQDARDIANWILENGQDPNLNYYAGIEGAIRLKAPEGTTQKGAFMLSATYSDHGTINNPKQYLSSKDRILVYIK